MLLKGNLKSRISSGARDLPVTLVITMFEVFSTQEKFCPLLVSGTCCSLIIAKIIGRC